MVQDVDTNSQPDPRAEIARRSTRNGQGSLSSDRFRRGVQPSFDDLAQRVVVEILDRIAAGRLDIVLPDGTVRRCGPMQASKQAQLVIHNPSFFGHVLWRPQIALGESYVAGEWETDDLAGTLGLLMMSVERARERQPFAALNALGRHRPRLPARQTFSKAEKNIHYHYDLGNEFFQVFLDESMTYSCGYFVDSGESLESAQQNKYRRICEKLHLSSGDHVLEIGCGWGGFAIHAAREYGTRVTALTISREQFALASRRVVEAGLTDLVEVRYQDYRKTVGRFSRIVSIEMLEAIGHAQLGTFFARCDHLLESDGLACIQTIAMPDQRYERYRRRSDWIREYIFPGANLPSLTAVATAMTRSSDLTIHEVEDIGIHYSATLRAWRERFHDNIEQVRALGYDKRFERMWEFYLASCEAGFEIRSLRDLQIVLTRPLNASLPRYP